MISVVHHFRTDINECAYHNGGCSHNCKNTNGSYHCSCPDPELSLALDNHSCIGEYSVILNKGRYVILWRPVLVKINIIKWHHK